MRTLKDLPEHLLYCDFSRPTNPPAGEHCIVCLRKFDTFEDPSNPSERPCRCLQLKACNHLIGSECLIKMVQRDMVACPQCTRQITVVVPVPSWITSLLRYDDVEHYLLAPGVIVKKFTTFATSKGPEASRRWDKIHEQLFNGTLSHMEGLKLWSRYLEIGVILELGTALVFVLLYWGFEGLFKLLKLLPSNPAMHMLLQLMAGPDIGAGTLLMNLGAMSIVKLVALHHGHVLRGWWKFLINLVTVLAANCLTQFLSPWKIMVGVMVGNFLVHAAMTSTLIAIGVRHRRRL